MVRIFFQVFWVVAVFLFGVFASNIFYTVSSIVAPNPNGALKKQSDIYGLFYSDLRRDSGLNPLANHAHFEYSVGGCKMQIDMPTIWKNESRIVLETSAEPGCKERALILASYTFETPRNRGKFMKFSASPEGRFVISNAEVSITETDGIVRISFKNLYIN